MNIPKGNNFILKHLKQFPLQDERLEFAYLRYAHRQRQKSLMLVNSADIILKILVVLRVLCILHDDTIGMY